MATAKVLVIAGGGGGGGGGGGKGGGGAGGYLYDSAHTVTATTYSVTVGAKGLGDGRGSPNFSGSDGGNSVFDTLTAIGGGGGGGNVGGGHAGYPGGSGGGGSDGVPTGGAGTVGQGNDGYNGSAGGGGSNGVGTALSGGAGTANSITGSSVTYAKGGDKVGVAPGANPGDGGASDSWNGADGIVIVAFTTTDFSGFSYSGSYTTGINGSETWVSMTTSGNLVLSAAATANSGFLMFMN